MSHSSKSGPSYDPETLARLEKYRNETILRFSYLGKARWLGPDIMACTSTLVDEECEKRNQELPLTVVCAPNPRPFWKGDTKLKKPVCTTDVEIEFPSTLFFQPTPTTMLSTPSLTPTPTLTMR